MFNVSYICWFMIFFSFHQLEKEFQTVKRKSCQMKNQIKSNQIKSNQIKQNKNFIVKAI